MGATRVEATWQDWDRQVADAPHLSEAAKRRWATVLFLNAPAAPPTVLDHAWALASQSPWLAARALNGKATPAGSAEGGRGEALATGLGSSWSAPRHWRRSLREPGALAEFLSGHAVLLGNGPSADWVVDQLSGCGDLAKYLSSQAPLEQTRVPVHPSRCARLVRGCDDQAGTHVALKWSIESLPVRWMAQRHLERLLDGTDSRPGDVLPFVVKDDYALIRDEADARNVWVLAANMGETLEDALRENRLNEQVRGQVVVSLAWLRRRMIGEGVIWQGFAPRNMFLTEQGIALIDFERVTHAEEDPSQAASDLLWHHVFFADCLTPGEHQEVFGNELDPLGLGCGTMMRADPFEAELLGRSSLTWQERTGLMAVTLEIEGAHQRPSPDHGWLFGHALGHFWGDFVDPHNEVALFRFLRPAVGVDSDRRLVAACLEVLEAAMESDLILGMAAGSGLATSASLGTPTTDRLSRLLEHRRVDEVARVRLDTAGWYERLAEDPSKLCDDLELELEAVTTGITQQSVGQHFLGAESWRGEHRAALHEVVDTGLRFLHGETRAGRVLQHAEPDALRRLIAEALPERGDDFDRVLKEFDERVASMSIAQSASGYLAFPDAGNALPAVAGALLSPLLNQNLIAVDRSAPAATFVEIQVIEWLRELVGYEAASLQEMTGVRDVAGLWTTGGHMSNHIAMLVALGERYPEVRAAGLSSLDEAPAVVMSGPIAHYSHSDAAFHLGLGWDNVIQVAARPDYTTDPEAVAAALHDPPAGRRPFVVVGVAGNCRTTGLDDLVALADVCEAHGVWFHVDACHGGNLLFSRRLRERLLEGIERADSVSLDPHKGLFTPYPSSYVLFRERGKLCHFSRHAATVQQPGCWDLGLVMPFFGSRGFESLRTWFLLKVLGTDGIGALVEQRQALIRYLERRLAASPWFVSLNDVDFYRLAFVFCPNDVLQELQTLVGPERASAAAVISSFTSQLNETLYREGQVCFDEHTLQDLGNRLGLGTDHKYLIIAACPGNPLLTAEDVDEALDRLQRHAGSLAGELRRALRMGGHASQQPAVRGPAGWNDTSTP